MPKDILGDAVKLKYKQCILYLQIGPHSHVGSCGLDRPIQPPARPPDVRVLTPDLLVPERLSVHLENLESG